MKIGRFFKRNWFLLFSYFFIGSFLICLSGIYNKEIFNNTEKLGVLSFDNLQFNIINSEKLNNKDVLDFTEKKDNITLQTIVSKNPDIYAIFSNKELKVPIIKGEFLNKDYSDKKVCVIGKEFQNLIKIKDSKEYFEINKELFEVVGIMGYEEKESPYDKKIYINIDNYVTCENDISSSWNIDYDAVDRDFLKSEFSNYIEKADKSAKISVQSSLKEENDRNRDSNNKVIIIVFIILLFIVIINGAYFWINGLLKEIGIRKMLGATNTNVAKYIISEQMIIFIVSLLFNIIICMLINLKYKLFVENDAILIFLVLVMIELLICLISIVRVLKVKIINMIRR